MDFIGDVGSGVQAAETPFRKLGHAFANLMTGQTTQAGQQPAGATPAPDDPWMAWSRYVGEQAAKAQQAEAPIIAGKLKLEQASTEDQLADIESKKITRRGAEAKAKLQSRLDELTEELLKPETSADRRKEIEGDLPALEMAVYGRRVTGSVRQVPGTINGKPVMALLDPEMRTYTDAQSGADITGQFKPDMPTALLPVVHDTTTVDPLGLVSHSHSVSSRAGTGAVAAPALPRGTAGSGAATRTGTPAVPKFPPVVASAYKSAILNGKIPSGKIGDLVNEYADANKLPLPENVPPALRTAVVKATQTLQEAEITVDSIKHDIAMAQAKPKEGNSFDTDLLSRHLQTTMGAVKNMKGGKALLDFALTQRGLDQELAAQISKVRGGGILTPQQRAAFLDQAVFQVSERQKAVDELRSQTTQGGAVAPAASAQPLVDAASLRSSLQASKQAAFDKIPVGKTAKMPDGKVYLKVDDSHFQVAPEQPVAAPTVQ